MSITYERAEDAYLAVVWAVLVADNVGTIRDRNFIHVNVKGIALFNDYSEEEYSMMVGAMYVKVSQTLLDEGGALIEERVLEMVAAVNECLNYENCLEVYRMAVEIACEDELCEEEKKLLSQFRSGLNIEKNDADEVHAEFEYMS